MPTLVLVRHGQSLWNLENRFTGWWDVDLSPTGEEEARQAGRLLAAEGLLPDVAHTSCLPAPSGPSTSSRRKRPGYGSRCTGTGGSTSATTGA